MLDMPFERAVIEKKIESYNNLISQVNARLNANHNEFEFFHKVYKGNFYIAVDQVCIAGKSENLTFKQMYSFNILVGHGLQKMVDLKKVAGRASLLSSDNSNLQINPTIVFTETLVELSKLNSSIKYFIKHLANPEADIKISRKLVVVREAVLERIENAALVNIHHIAQQTPSVSQFFLKTRLLVFKLILL